MRQMRSVLQNAKVRYPVQITPAQVVPASEPVGVVSSDASPIAKPENETVPVSPAVEDVVTPAPVSDNVSEIVPGVVNDNEEESSDVDVTATEQDMNNAAGQIVDQLQDIENMSDLEFLSLLGKVSEYQILREKYEKAKEREQSTANKLLGAAAMGAGGIGLMNTLSGLAEQSADQSAEEDMRAYLATFTCDYGQGRNIKGGDMDVELPGGNALLQQVNEYRALAADLKVRKEALGKAPGIESEVIYDIAETGLYDNVGVERSHGAYTSLSRALTDETSADAAEWAKQTKDAKDKTKVGGITAGVGVVGGAAGNLIINRDKDKTDSNASASAVQVQK